MDVSAVGPAQLFRNLVLVLPAVAIVLRIIVSTGFAEMDGDNFPVEFVFAIAAFLLIVVAGVFFGITVYDQARYPTTKFGLVVFLTGLTVTFPGIAIALARTGLSADRKQTITLFVRNSLGEISRRQRKLMRNLAMAGMLSIFVLLLIVLWQVDADPPSSLPGWTTMVMPALVVVAIVLTIILIIIPDDSGRDVNLSRSRLEKALRVLPEVEDIPDIENLSDEDEDENGLDGKSDDISETRGLLRSTQLDEDVGLAQIQSTLEDASSAARKAKEEHNRYVRLSAVVDGFREVQEEVVGEQEQEGNITYRASGGLANGSGNKSPGNRVDRVLKDHKKEMESSEENRNENVEQLKKDLGSGREQIREALERIR